MAYFAELNELNVVVRVIAVSNDDIKDEHGIEQESIGIAFCKNLVGQDTNWRQTSYNKKFRFHYAGKGYTYDPGLDAFIPPKLYPSWVLDPTTADWKSPLGDAPQLTEEQKIEGYSYNWNEGLQQWELMPPLHPPV